MPPDPKDPAVRQRRNHVSTAGVIDAQFATMPPLGARRPDKTAWHPETRRWWRTIWASAISGRWIDAHVPGLRQLARLVDDYWRATDPVTAKQIHAEIRMQSREYGLSPMAARSLNWEFRRPIPHQDTPSPLPPGADPRSILTAPSRRRAAGG